MSLSGDGRNYVCLCVCVFEDVIMFPSMIRGERKGLPWRLKLVDNLFGLPLIRLIAVLFLGTVSAIRGQSRTVPPLHHRLSNRRRNRSRC